MPITPSEHTIRQQMLACVGAFVQAVQAVAGVRRVALIGSIVTTKPNPKDVDLLVTVADDADLTPLAVCARRRQGRLQGDVFLADEQGKYLGRTCTWRECRPGIRASCDALHCGRRPHVHMDIRLSPAIIASPPVLLWPVVVRRSPAPRDIETFLATLEHAV